MVQRHVVLPVRMRASVQHRDEPEHNMTARSGQSQLPPLRDPLTTRDRATPRRVTRPKVARSGWVRGPTVGRVPDPSTYRPASGTIPVDRGSTSSETSVTASSTSTERGLRSQLNSYSCAYSVISGGRRV
jgi:hypothetical protein